MSSRGLILGIMFACTETLAPGHIFCLSFKLIYPGEHKDIPVTMGLFETTGFGSASASGSVLVSGALNAKHALFKTTEGA